jgi:hypothetical protein
MGRMRKFSTGYGIKATAQASGPGSEGSTNNLGAGSFSMGTTSDAALWANALVASRAPVATTAKRLDKGVHFRSLRLCTRDVEPISAAAAGPVDYTKVSADTFV